jgi:hypothetical protein
MNAHSFQARCESLRIAPFRFPIRNDRNWLAKIINHPSIHPIYLLVIIRLQFRAILRRI